MGTVYRLAAARDELLQCALYFLCISPGVADALREDQGATAGEAIVARQDGSLQGPDRPVVPFIEGDGIGVDVTPVMRAVVDAAVEKSYGARRGIVWMEIFAGEM